jgi:hypothetical protein
MGGTAGGGEWVQFELHLGGTSAEAHTIGITAWVLQEPFWSISTPPARHIPRNDVHGGAWFDDITIYALPRVELTTNVPGNILVPGRTQELQVVLGDSDNVTLQGRITITSADGTSAETHLVSVEAGSATEPARLPVDHLPPGLYNARLEVLASGTAIASRTLAFARVAQRYRNSEALAQPFGVVIDSRQRSDATTELALLRGQVVRSAKLPVWTGLPEEPATLGERRTTDRLLQELVKRGFALTGVFAGPPSALTHSAGGLARPLLDLLSGSQEVWREHLAAVVAPHASTFRWWQVGADGPNTDSFAAHADRLVLAAEKLREEMRAYLTMPLLSLPISSAVELSSQKLPTEQVSLHLGHELPPSWFASRIEPLVAAGYEHLSAYVEPLPADKYARLPRLADWASRLIAARHAGVDTVYVPQTWSVRETAYGRVTEPLEEYLILRTIADVIADAVPGQRVQLAEGVECLVFHEGELSVLAVWDPYAPREGSRHAVQLGSADRQVDLWGRATPLERDQHGRQILVLSPMPILVPNVERWLVEFGTGMALRPQHVESGTELVQHTVEMAYNGSRPVAGSMVLEGPDSWSISPRHLTFNLMPRARWSQPVEVRYPHNEPAGKKQIIAEITLASDSRYFEVPLTVEIGLTDVEVWGLAFVEGDDLVLRHAVTNRSSEALSFRGSATAPGYERQYRPFLDLRPGHRQSVEYRFRGAVDLIGRSVRLGLREMNDGPRIHNLELIVP